jgi:uncharacterized coiled-coil protein SlyX
MQGRLNRSTYRDRGPPSTQSLFKVPEGLGTPAPVIASAPYRIPGPPARANTNPTLRTPSLSPPLPMDTETMSGFQDLFVADNTPPRPDGSVDMTFASPQVHKDKFAQRMAKMNNILTSMHATLDRQDQNLRALLDELRNPPPPPISPPQFVPTEPTAPPPPPPSKTKNATKKKRRTSPISQGALEEAPSAAEDTSLQALDP